MKYSSWLLIVAGLSLAMPRLGRAQETPAGTVPAAPVETAEADHAPRAYGIALSGTYAFLSRLPLAKDGSSYRPGGVSIGGRFGWQVRGLRGGAPSTIGVETDFAFLPGRDTRNGYALIYGVFAKHSFTQLRARPYFAYGLGAAQVWVSDVGGRGIGHATRLAFGLDIRVGERTHVSVALSYLGLLMPRFALDGGPARDTSMHAGVLSTGVWFGQ